MDPERSGIESRLDAHAARLSDLEARMAALEAGARREPGAPPAPVPVRTAAERPVGAAVVSTLTLVGRTLVVLGGAFLLRAVTEAGTVPQVAGTVAGLAYALLWLLMADRAAAHGHQTNAAFHALASAIIAYPLIAEATLKFHFLSPAWSAIALIVTFALGLGVAWRHSLLGLAWVMTLGSVAAAVGMAFASRAFFPFVGSLLLLGAMTVWSGETRGWTLLGGFVAAIADLMVGLVTVAFVGAHPSVPRILAAPWLLLLQCGLVAVYFGGPAWRSLLRRHDLALVEIVQAALAFGIGFGGAVAVVRVTGGFDTVVGMVALVLGGCSYAAAFTFMDRKQGSRTNFLYYSTLALVLVLTGMNTLFEGNLRSVICAAASLGTAWIGSRWRRATLSGHGAFYAVAAGVGSGLLPAGIAAFFGSSFEPVPWFTVPVSLVLVVTMANCWFEVAKHGRTWGRLSVVPKLVVLCGACVGVGGILVGVVAQMARIGAGDVLDGQALAAIRTGVLAASALVLATLSRWRRFAEAFWLVYPLLVLGGVKLLSEDLRHGRPATVFASLVLYGIALIVAPRLVRRNRGPIQISARP